MKYFIFIAIFCCLLIACKEEKPQEPIVKTELEKAADHLASDGTVASAALYLIEIKKTIAQNEDKTKEKELLDLGLETAKKYKLQKEVVSFLVPLVKDYPKSSNAEEHLSSLILAVTPGNEVAGNIMISGYLNQYPDGKYKDIVNGVKTMKIDDPTVQLDALGRSIFDNPDHQGVNKVAARKYVDAAEAYAITFSDNENVPNYLFKAGEIARSLTNYNKAISIFDWIGSHYSDSKDAPNALFLKGFILDTDFGNLEAARKEYSTFIDKYPNHELAKSAEFLVENLGKSDEQLKIEMNEKNKNNQ